jgi:hypothetical protein
MSRTTELGQIAAQELPPPGEVVHALQLAHEEALEASTALVTGARLKELLPELEEVRSAAASAVGDYLAKIQVVMQTRSVDPVAPWLHEWEER